MPDETDRDKQLDHLLQEARVAMPGVQILFGFLLAVPFQQRFALTDTLQRNVYLVAVLGAAFATMCFIAPASYHRILFGRVDAGDVIPVANRFLIAGVASLAVAMTAALVLVTDLWFRAGTTVAVGVGAAVLFVVLWFGLPLARGRAAVR